MSTVARAMSHAVRAMYGMAAVGMVTIALEVMLPNSVHQAVLIVMWVTLAALFVYGIGYTLRSWYLVRRLRSENASADRLTDVHILPMEARRAFQRRQVMYRFIGLLVMLGILVWKVWDFYLR